MKGFHLEGRTNCIQGKTFDGHYNVGHPLIPDVFFSFRLEVPVSNLAAQWLQFYPMAQDIVTGLGSAFRVAKWGQW